MCEIFLFFDSFLDHGRQVGPFSFLSSRHTYLGRPTGGLSGFFSARSPCVRSYRSQRSYVTILPNISFPRLPTCELILRTNTYTCIGVSILLRSRIILTCSFEDLPYRLSTDGAKIMWTRVVISERNSMEISLNISFPKSRR